MKISIEKMALVADPGLVSLIYEAALNPGLWDEVLREICNHCTCSQAMLLAHHPAEASITFFYSHGIAPEYLASFAKRFAMVSPNATKCFFNDLGEAQCSELFDDLAIFRDSLYFKEWCCPQNVQRQCIVMLVRNEAKCGALIVSLKESDDASANATMQALSNYANHFMRALRIHNTLVEQAKAAELARGTLDRINAPVMMLDGDMKIVAFNKRASELENIAQGINAGSFLASIYGQPHVSALFAGTVNAVPGSGWREALVRPLHDKGSQPHVLTLIELPPNSALPPGFVLGSKASALVMIHDMGAEKPARPEVFIKLFRLTPSEAQVLSLLARGLKASEIAIHQGVAITTVRSQVAAVMEKTGARRQSDLVRMAINTMLPTAFVGATP